jgi:putative aldouronate transport system permease protein
MKPRKLTWEEKKKLIRKSRYLYLLLVIPTIYYILFHYLPMYGVIIAFKNYNVGTGILKSRWVGGKWFLKFLKDAYFWKLVRNTLLLNIYNLLWGFPVPILLALMLNELTNAKFKRAIQTVSYLPHFISTVVVCGMVVNFLSMDGIFNQILGALGLTKIQFLMYPQYFRTIYISSEIWQTCGWTSIIYLAALTSVDRQIEEAAMIDGANRYQRMLHVTLPAISPTISIMLIMQLGKLMSIGYEKIILLYNGSTYETADVISTYVYRRGILSNDFSYATAVGLFQSVIGVVLLIAANKISKKISETSLW